MAFRPNWYDQQNRRSNLGRAIEDWSAIRLIATLCGVVFLLQLVTASWGSGHVIEQIFGLRTWTISDGGIEGGILQPPTLDFNFLFPIQLFSYMLLHSAGDMSHIFWNLVLLWIFGRELEASMGKQAFLRLFIVGGVFGGLCQWGYNLYTGDPTLTIGASGAVYTVMVLYACRWPRRTIYLIFPPIPVPAALLIGLKVLGDIGGFFGGAAQVAYLVHLGGAAVGYLWFRKGDVVGQVQMKRSRDRAEKQATEKSTDRREMDRILGKIQATGLSSLDKKERSFLDQRSRELREER